MAKVRGVGQLRHHFWGNYHATIVVAFADEATAKNVLPSLPGFVAGKDPKAVVFHGSGDDFEVAKSTIKALRVPSSNRRLSVRDSEEIDSCNRSIDLGPPFEIVIDVVPFEQTSLFGC